MNCWGSETQPARHEAGSPGQWGPLLLPISPRTSDFKRETQCGFAPSSLLPSPHPWGSPLPPGLQPFLFPAPPPLPPLSVSLSFLSSSLTLSLTRNASSCASCSAWPYIPPEPEKWAQNGCPGWASKGPHFRGTGKKPLSLSTDRLADVSPGSASARGNSPAGHAGYLDVFVLHGGQPVSLGLSLCKTADEPEGDSSPSDHGADTCSCLHLPGACVDTLHACAHSARVQGFTHMRMVTDAHAPTHTLGSSTEGWLHASYSALP